MEVQSYNPTPEQAAALRKLAKETGKDVQTLVSRAVDLVLEERIRWIEDLRQAYQEGLDSGPSTPLNIEEIIEKARRRWDASRAH